MKLGTNRWVMNFLLKLKVQVSYCCRFWQLRDDTQWIIRETLLLITLNPGKNQVQNQDDFTLSNFYDVILLLWHWVMPEEFAWIRCCLNKDRKFYSICNSFYLYSAFPQIFSSHQWRSTITFNPWLRPFTMSFLFEEEPFGMHIFHQSPSSTRYLFYWSMESWKYTIFSIPISCLISLPAQHICRSWEFCQTQLS